MKNRLFPHRYLGLAAAILMLAGMAAPPAHGGNNPPGSALITYFNFNDGPTGGGFMSDAPGAHGTADMASVTKLTATYIAPSNAGNVATLDPVAPGAANNFYLHLVPTQNGAKSFQFTTSTVGFTNLALSFAIQGSGFTTATVTYNVLSGTNAGSAGTIGTTSITSTFQTASFDLSAPVFDVLDNQTSVQFTITFGPTNPNGSPFVDLDNIQLTNTPEPSTVAAGLLGVFGLCWHQRRRLGKILPLKFSRKAVA